MKDLCLGTALTVLLMWPATVSAQSDCGGSYAVVSGDVLSAIAARCGTSVAALVSANPFIDDPNVIEIGWTLTIPTDGGRKRPVDPERERRSEPDRRYTVARGDSLVEIARRFSTTVAGLIDANPEIGSADEIEPGDVLEIPADRLPREMVSISPRAGAPGSEVRVLARGFPPRTMVEIGAGPVASEYEILDRARTDRSGAIDERVWLPDHARPDREWVFVVTTTDHASRARSNRFEVRSRESGRPADRDRRARRPVSRDSDSESVTVVGVLVDEGVECPAIRGEDGRLYTLAGGGRDIPVGTRVRVSGAVAEVSTCMQGTTLGISELTVLEEAVQRDRVTVTGVVTDEGVECPAVSSDDGRLFTLAGAGRDLAAGTRVRVSGVVAEVSTCMQGTTLGDVRIRVLEDLD